MERLRTLKLPVGIDNFEKIRKSGFYYIDKTRLIEQLLQNWGEVNLFTRPRRFGKTLNMSMFKSFFEIGTDPVVFISFKDVNGLTFDRAYDALVQIIGEIANGFSFLMNSDKLSKNEKEQYQGIIQIKDGKYHMSDGVVISSLKVLSQLLTKHYGKNTIFIIDE